MNGTIKQGVHVTRLEKTLEIFMRKIPGLNEGVGTSGYIPINVAAFREL
jgi:hypothetical protein